ncbi:hypothetical protein B0H10DRAFT_2099203 [Mycena sp. CBHHK59/15]|nr:hypothetical protein B0H10DRAFT_2099203 [Mycena sp. CBHHK59/15]
MPPLTVKVHSIQHPSNWPPELINLTRLLSSPLPQWCATGPYPFVSERNVALVSELFRLSSHAEPSEFTSSPSLSEVFNSVLSTVLDIRCLAERAPCTPFWYSLVRLLGHVAAPEAFTIGETPFILPRTAADRRLDGHATLLVGLIVTSPEPDSNHTNCGIVEIHKDSDPPSVVEITGESRHSGVSHPSESNHDISLNQEVSDPPSVMEDDIESSHSSVTSTRSLDVVVEGHVLPGRGRHLDAFLPILCIADSDNIVPLMCSVACQRYVWGISDPVVGFLFSETRAVVRLVVAWIDPVTCVVHIAYASEIATCAQITELGVFDLADSATALSFAQLVLNLSLHFENINTASATCANNRLDWRADKMTAPPEYDPADWRDRVSQWVHDVETTAVSSSSDNAQSSLPSEQFIVSEDMSTPESTHRQPSRAKSTNVTPPSQPTTGALELPTSSSPAPGESKSKLKVKSSSKALSSSELARLSAKGMADAPSISTWMADREVFAVARLRMKEGSQEGPEKSDIEAHEINENIAKYDAMTGFRWPASWIQQNTFPPVDLSLSAVKDVLVAELKKLKEKDVTFDDLSSEALDIISGRLSAILSAAVGAFTLDAKRQGISVYEAESRHDWDALLYRFYATASERVSAYVLLERTINYPRNPMADDMDDEAFKSRYLGLVTDYSLHCSAAAIQATTQVAAHSVSRDVRVQAAEAAGRASEYLNSVEGLLEDLSNARARVTLRAKKDPRSGKTDALLFAAIPDTFKLTKEKHVAIVTGASPDSTNSHIDDTMVSHLEPDTQKSKVERDSLLENPFTVTQQDCAIPDIPRKFQEVPSFVGSLLLPHVAVEYKKASDTKAKALNQGRMYIVSVVAFYAALGIKNYPFYCLVTTGKVGAVLMAWRSSKLERTYIMERNIRKFDLSSPLQAFHFATFLIRLRADQENLKNNFAQQKQIDMQTVKRWSMTSQGEHNGWPMTSPAQSMGGTS